MEISLLRALAHQQQGNATGALDALTQAVTLAEPEEVGRLFLDEGEPLRTLLTRLRRERTDVAPEYVTELQVALGDTAAPAPVRRSVVEPFL
ncbi:MAG: hypothetical protein KDD73_16000, partial [Anaerolineales bacterium]|nr:hypothetical protein [Anaerolineales bacterium]